MESISGKPFGSLPLTQARQAAVQSEAAHSDTSDRFVAGAAPSGELSKPSMLTSAPQESWNREQRPAELLKTLPDGRVEISNVRWGFKEAAEKKDWEPSFQTVTVDPSQVKNVYLAVEPFKPEWIAGHTFLIFEFKNGDGLKASNGESDRGLVISVEARLKDGQEFNLMDGMKNKFKLVHQMGSWTDVVQKTCRREGHRIMRYPLSLDDSQKEKLLRNGIERACTDRSNEYYHTTQNSCFSNLVHLVNTVLPKSEKIREWLIPSVLYNPAANLPTTSSFVFGVKHIIGDTPPVITEPDKKSFPDAGKKDTIFNKAVRTLSEKPLWNTAVTMGGLLLGGAVGSMLPPPVIGTVIGAVIGGASAHEGAQHLKRESHGQKEPSEQFLQAGH